MVEDLRVVLSLILVVLIIDILLIIFMKGTESWKDESG